MNNNKKIDFFNKNKKINSESNTNKRMGRKPKDSSGSKTQKPNIPKRRGRRPKKILENVDDISENSSQNEDDQKNNSAVILRLNIDPNRLKKMKPNKKHNTGKKKEPTKKSSKKKVDTDDDVPDEINEESDGMFKNDIPGDSVCQKCAKNEKSLNLLKSKLEKYEKKEKIDRSNKIYNNDLNFISYKSGKKTIIKKTNCKCWWDAHNFTSLPCFLPELYHNNTYHVTGCFCSFNCALAYNLYFVKDSKIHQRKALIYKLYRELYRLNSDEIIEIKEAPPKEILEDFGGKMSIDIFRRSFATINKEYIRYIPPIKPITLTIEERNIDTNDDGDDKKYVLKRSKPLAKKRSVISSMKLSIEEDDD